MKRRTPPPDHTIVGYSATNLAKTVEMLLSMSAASAPIAHPDVEHEPSLARLDTPEALRIREQLLHRAEQPFVEEWDHVVYGQTYGRQDEHFRVVYEALTSEPDEPIETRNGGRASVMARFLIRP